MTSAQSCSCKNQSQSTTDQLVQQMETLDNRLHMLTDHVTELTLTDSNDKNARSRLKSLAIELARITGGRPVENEGFAECCLIGNVSGFGYLNNWFCSGTLIHPRVVVTAQHCIGSSRGVPDPNSIAIGVEKQRDVRPDHIYRILRVHEHPIEDIALLVLQRPCNVKPVGRASHVDLTCADNVQLVGFGNSNPGGTSGFGIKREVEVPMQVVRDKPGEDWSDAEAKLGFDSFSEFVAGRKGSGKDSCNGDSGGPAYVKKGDDWLLAGATSRATDEADDNCGDGGIYVRIDAVADWIDEVINSLK